MKITLLILGLSLAFAQQSLPPTPVDQGFTGKCPVCQQQHLESRLVPGSGETTKKECESFDAPGKNGALVHHYHECNTTTWQFSCSRGHKFQVLDYGHSCPVGDWPRPSAKVVTR